METNQLMEIVGIQSQNVVQDLYISKPLAFKLNAIALFEFDLLPA